jgi:ABC-type Fe3+-hydroxamate transport system substrate-binding protein
MLGQISGGKPAMKELDKEMKKRIKQIEKKVGKIGKLYKDDTVSVYRSADGVISVFCDLPIEIGYAFPNGICISKERDKGNPDDVSAIGRNFIPKTISIPGDPPKPRK